MRRLVGGKARLVATVVALVTVATFPSCAGGSANQGPKPVITPNQAAAVTLQVQAKRVAAFGSENPTDLSSADSDPQLSIDQGQIRTALSTNGSVSDTPYLSATPMVPKQTAYPAWFMAVVSDESGSSLDLFDRQSSSKPWLLVAETSLQGASVPWKKIRDGWAVAETPVADPSKALAAYWNQNTNGADVSGVPVTSGDWTSGIATQINTAITSNKAHGWAQIAVFGADGPLTQGLELTNGTVLGFAWVTEVLKTRDSYGPCFVQPDSTGFRWDPLVPNGNYLEVDVNYYRIAGMSVPTNGPLSARSYEEGTTGVVGTPCTG